MVQTRTMPIAAAGAILMSAALLALIALLPADSPAHGFCSAAGYEPYKSNGQVKGKGDYVCTDTHYILQVRACLQKKRSDGSIVYVGTCVVRSASSTASIAATAYKPCNSSGDGGTFRVEAKGFVQQEDGDHEQPDTSVGPWKTINCP